MVIFRRLHRSKITSPSKMKSNQMFQSISCRNTLTLCTIQAFVCYLRLWNALKCINWSYYSVTIGHAHEFLSISSKKSRLFSARHWFTHICLSNCVDHEHLNCQSIQVRLVLSSVLTNGYIHIIGKTLDEEKSHQTIFARMQWATNTQHSYLVRPDLLRTTGTTTDLKKLKKKKFLSNAWRGPKTVVEKTQ